MWSIGAIGGRLKDCAGGAESAGDADGKNQRAAGVVRFSDAPECGGRHSFCTYKSDDYDFVVIAIRAIFDGTAFVPEEPVSLPAQSEVLVIVDQASASSKSREEFDAAVRAYYQQVQGGDSDDEAWRDATASQSHKAWDED